MNASPKHRRKTRIAIRPTMERLEARALLSATQYTFHTVASFNGVNGTGPAKILVDSAGNLIGSTVTNNSSGDGTAFKINKGSSAITVLASLSGPSDLSIDTSGNLFGTDSSGFFELTSGTYAYQSIGPNNIGPYPTATGAVTIGPGGNLYGIIYGEDQATETYAGSIVELSNDGSGGYGYPVGIANLPDQTAPVGALTSDSNGDLFGIVSIVSDATGEMVYELTSGMDVPGTVANLAEADISGPWNVTVDSKDDIFGTSYGGGTGNGIVFEIVHGASTITTLASFNGTDGSDPVLSAPTLDSNGDLFGTTIAGGANGGGTVYEIVHGSNSISTLFNFSSGADAGRGVVFDTSGDLYGTTFGGGDANGDGTVFELTPDKTAPTATLSAPNITSAGGTTESVKVIYNDNVAVSAASIKTSNLSVTGPGGDPLNVTGVSLSPNANAATITATYTVAAPAGSWSFADNGTYAVTLLGGQVSDTSGNFAVSKQTTFTVNTASTGPTAMIAASDLISAAASESISVTYTDSDAAINTGTIAPTNLTVTDPNGSTLGVSLMGIVGSGNSVTATYLASPAGGPFSIDGNYMITLAAGSVKDAAGMGVTSTTGIFSVNISGNSTPPTASISTSVVTLPADSETITVVYSDPSTPIDPTTITGANLAVVPPTGPVLAANLVNTSGTGDTITATYSVAPPNGAWGNSDDGVYTVTVRAASVKDIAGNSVGAAAGSFTVNLSADASFNGGSGVNVPFAVKQSLALSGGQILLVGFEGVGAASVGELEELNSDGTLDPGFNAGNAVRLSLPNTQLEAAAVDGAGNIVVAGTSGGSFLIARYTGAGALDTTFGANGITRADFATGDAVATSVAIATDGAIVAAGGAGGKLALTLLDRNGMLDPAFNPDGASDNHFSAGGQETVANTNGSLSQVVIGANGKIIGVGNNGANVSLVRLNPDGSMDTSFGSNGIVAAVQNLTAQNSNGILVPLGIAIASGGNILVIGEAQAGGVGVDQVLANGSPDSSFGSSGTQTVNFGGGPDDQPGVVSVDPTTGAFVLIGATVLAGADQTVVAAFDPNGTQEQSCGHDGLIMLAAGSGQTGTDSLSSAPSSGGTLQVQSVHPLSVHGVHGIFGGFDRNRNIVVGNRGTSSSVVQRLQPFTVTQTEIGTVTTKPRTFAISSTTFTISATGGSVDIAQIGSQFDLTLTPKRANGSMAVTIHIKSGPPLTLADVTAANDQAVHLTTFNAPGAMLAGTMSINGAIGTLKLSSISGLVRASSISNLTTGDVSGSINCLDTLGVAHLGAVTGVISAGKMIRNISALNVDSATILAGANLGADGQIGGAGADADAFGSGKILAMNFVALTNSFIGAGVDPGDGIFGNGNDKAEPGTDQIGAITVKSGLGGTGAVVFETAQFPKRAHLPETISTASDPQHFVVV